MFLDVNLESDNRFANSDYREFLNGAKVVSMKSSIFLFGYNLGGPLGIGIDYRF